MRAPKTPAEDGSRGFVPGPWCAARLTAALAEQVCPSIAWVRRLRCRVHAALSGRMVCALCRDRCHARGFAASWKAGD